MSRRHHGRPHHGRHRGDGPRPDAGTARPAVPAPDVAPPEANAALAPSGSLDTPSSAHATPPVAHENGASTASTQSHVNGYTNGRAQQNGNGDVTSAANVGERAAGCTAPQLRRFIKSRPYVPMHELRRRFGINGAEDEVTPVQLPVGQVWVGLPRREGDLLGELLRNGEIGYELSLDPRSPIVVGLYPMRPVPRA